MGGSNVSSTKSIVLWSLGALLAVLALVWIFQGNDFFVYKFFAPRRVEVQRQVFDESRSFNQGMVQELENMRFEYVKTQDSEAKEAMASIILHRASGYNLNDPVVPADLRSFIDELKRESLNPTLNSY